jgi:hypothetical protein
MIVDTMMTSVFTGISFVLAVLVYSLAGGISLNLAAGSGRVVQMIAFGLGLSLGVGIVVVFLRGYSDQLAARSRNLRRGAWIGSMAGLVIIVVLYYLPWIAFPQYCPPGAICQ